jgi:2-haloalkanoic acid dehalogenase type II
MSSILIDAGVDVIAGARRPRPRAILLDFYGTIVEEDDPVVAGICREIAAASRTQTPVDEIASSWWRVFQGLCAASFGSAFRCQRDIERAALETVLEQCAADVAAEDLSARLYDYWSAPRVFPESLAALAACQVPQCLVSNIDTADLQSALDHLGISFDYVVTSQDARAYKPRREPFERALALLGCSSRQVLHVGDSFSSDVVGAREVGILVLWINRKRRTSPGAPTADFVAEDLRALPAILNGE